MTTNINQLANELLKHRIDYENGNPTISDAQYDALELRLKKLAPKHPIFNMVGAPQLGTDIKHLVPMISQEKALTVDAAAKWIEKHLDAEEEYVFSGKHDGMSCALHYENGKLSKAVSRGDGEYGSDITAKVSLIVPISLPVDFTGEVRGELVLSFKNFDALNKSLPVPMANIRNAVPGIINEDAISYDKIKFLDFRAFGVIWRCNKQLKYSVFEGNGKDTYVTDLFFLKSVGFEPVYHTFNYFYPSTDVKNELSEALQVFVQYKSGVSNDDTVYPLDGVVIRVNGNELYEELGLTAHHPRGSVAWKFQAESAVVTIKDIDWSVGTKDISPVAEFEPTIIDGALISKVSLKSVKNMVDLGVTIGSRVEIVRSGGVIPWAKRRVD